MEKVKVLFLDLDGTIRYSNNGDFINGKEEVEIYDGVRDTLQNFKKRGYILVGISNQGGVAFGFKTEQDVVEEIERTQELLGSEANLSFCFYSLTHPDGTIEEYSYESLFRKPGIGMLCQFESIITKQDKAVDWYNSLMVGDRGEDKQCAANADIEFIDSDTFFGR